MNKRKINKVYFGTANERLQSRIPIDPERGGNIFEFGNGFYLSLEKSVSEQYAVNAVKKNSCNNSTNQSTDDELLGIGYVHIYKINYRKMKKEQHKHFEFCTLKEFETVLRNTLNGYNNKYISDGYSPAFHFTKGLLCGAEWDGYWDIYRDRNTTGKVELSEVEIERLIRKCVRNSYETEQIAIHKKLKGNKNVINLKYLEYKGREAIKVFRDRIVIRHLNKKEETRY